jgi:hypothetical protein
MKKLIWSLAMMAVLALAVFILGASSGVSWTRGDESKPAGVKVNIDNFRRRTL